MALASSHELHEGGTAVQKTWRALATRLTSHVFRTGEEALTLSKIGPVPIKWSRPLPSESSSMTMIREWSSHWY